MSDLLTAKQLGDYFGVRRVTVLAWKRAGKISAVIDLPGTIRFDLAQVRKRLADASDKAAAAKFSTPTL